MGKIKTFIENHIVDIVCITAFIFFVLGSWLLYTANRTANDYSDVHDTVQQAETDNRNARQQINSASTEINSAQKQLSVSIKRTGRITERTQHAKSRVDDNSRIVRECEDIISAGRRDFEEARGIFDSVDKANQGNGAQANSHA